MINGGVEGNLYAIGMLTPPRKEWSWLETSHCTSSKDGGWEVGWKELKGGKRPGILY